MQRFTLPRDLYHGKGALEALKTLEGKKAIVCVGGGSMKRNGFLDRAVNYLQEAGMEVKLFEGIEPDPSVETVMNLIQIGLLPWVEVHQLMQQKLCGLNMNIQISHLKICAKYLVFQNYVKKLISVLSHLLVVQQQKLLLSQLLQTIIKELNYTRCCYCRS